MTDAPAALAFSADARPVLKARCASGHRYGEVFRLPDGQFLWTGRLPAPSRAWDPKTWDTARAPLPPQERRHWSQSSWHWTQVEQGPLDMVLTGCRCSGRPATALWLDLRLMAADRSTREVLLRLRRWPRTRC